MKQNCSPIRFLIACNGEWSDDASVIWMGLAGWDRVYCRYHECLMPADLAL